MTSMRSIWYISAGLLFLGAVSMPSGYYDILRLVIFVTSLFAAYINYSIEKFFGL